MTEEQKEEIFKQEEIAKEITKDLDFAINSDEKGQEFEEMKGILSKKGKLGKYKERYFCVVGNSLCFYESSKLNKKEGEFEFSKIKSISIRDSKTKKNKGKKFEISLDKGQVVLKAKSESEAQKWVSYLNYTLQMYQINKI